MRQTFDIKPANFYQAIDEVTAAVIECDLTCSVVVTTKRESRSDLQNRLAQVWCGQMAKGQNLERDYVWGAWKLDQLLKIKLTDEALHNEATKEQLKCAGVVAVMCKVFPSVSRREHEVEAANELIRSKGLPVAVFAEWLTTIQQQAALAGVVLQSNREDVKRAIGNKT